MSNFISITGRLAGFDGKYTAAKDGKSSMMKWGVNVSQGFTVDGEKYPFSKCINIVAFGVTADKLQQINLLSKEDERRKNCHITIYGKISFAYKDKDGTAKDYLSVNVLGYDLVHYLDLGEGEGEQPSTTAPSITAPPKTVIAPKTKSKVNSETASKLARAPHAKRVRAK